MNKNTKYKTRNTTRSSGPLLKRHKFATVLLLLIILIGCAASQNLRADSDKEIFNRAKLALFDRKWDSALKFLEQLKNEHPNSAYRIKAMLYRGRCWEEKKSPRKALNAYNRFLKASDNEGLKEDVYGSIIELNFELYSRGEKGRIDKVIDFLDSELLTLRYYAAFKLSYAKSKKISEKAVPMLKKIIRYEEDAALVDRAKIALMRIGPRYLKEMTKSADPSRSMLVIRSYDKKSGNEKFNLSIPFSLAQLAFDALPKSAKEDLKKEGINFDGLLRKIMKSGELFRFESEGTVTEISIK